MSLVQTNAVGLSARNRIVALLAAPAVAVFLSSNVVNAGNLVFNMLFSRWMGPALFADLAFLLTIKLAVLNIFGAVQMAMSRSIAAADAGGKTVLLSAAIRLSRIGFVAGAVVALPLAALIWTGVILPGGTDAAMALGILALALPFALPLSIARGVRGGRIDTAALALTAQVEMGVRLVGAIAAWWLGLGIEGVVLAVAFSIVAGWAVVALPLTTVKTASEGFQSRAFAVLVLPLAALQIAQVGLLDADVLLAKAVLTPTETGHLAALALVQRVQVFACLGLAAVLVPQVAAAVAGGRAVWPVVKPVALIVALVSLAVAGAATVAPETLLSALAGPAFAGAAPQALAATGCAALFTLTYLAASYLAALGRTNGLWLMFSAVPVQALAMWQAAAMADATGLGAMMSAKLACQALLCGAMIALAMRATRSARRVSV